MPAPVIKSSSMSKQPEMQEKAIEISVQAVENCNTENEIASFVKKAFEKEYGHV